MKMLYIEPEVKIIKFDKENVITSSGIAGLPTDVISGYTAENIGTTTYNDIFSTNE